MVSSSVRIRAWSALGTLINLGLIGCTLFISAGRLDVPFFWAYLGLNAALSVVGLLAIDPGLMRERWRPGGSIGALLAIMLIGLPAYLTHMVVGGLDVGRFHWSDYSAPVTQTVCIAIAAAAWSIVLWAMIVNRFASSMVRIQSERGHELVTAGPYRYVRHPIYLGGIVGFVAGAAALGSWWAVASLIPIVVLILFRMVSEDRFLMRELPGYPDYARHVRYRLVPGIW